MRGVFDDVRQGDRCQARVDLDLHLGICLDAQRVSLHGMPHVSERRIDDVGRGDPLPFDADRLGVDARHVEDVLEQARQPLELGHGRTCLCATLVLGSSPRRFSTATRDGGQRRTKIMAERREQRGGQVRLLTDERRGVALAQELGSFDRNGDDAGDGVECADIERR